MTTSPRTTSISVHSILEKFSAQLSLLQGDKNTEIHGLNHPRMAKASDLIFLSDEDHLNLASDTQSLIWLIPPQLSDKIKNRPNLCLLESPNPKLIMAKIAKIYFRPTAHHIPYGDERISGEAWIDPSAQIGANVIVGAGAVIGKNCSIGDDCIIGSLTVIENDCQIGSHTHIHPQVFLGHGTTLGTHCEVKPHTVIGGEGFGYATDMKLGEHHRVTHFGRVVIGNHVHIGSGVHIDRGTFEDSRIGDQVKIDNFCHFGHNVEIGQGTIVTGGAITAGSVRIGKFCVIGGRTTISGHLDITDNVHIGGLSGVTKPITEPGQYGGYPLQPLSDYLKTQSSMRKVPELRKSVQKILRALNLKED